MSTEDNPLKPLERAHEEGWFKKHNDELVEKLRARLHAEKAAEEMASATGISDTELLETLAGFGVEKETLPVLHLVPLIQVAWADGEIQPEERELLFEAATQAGVTEGPARVAFERMLEQPPSRAFFDAALRFISAILAATPDDEAAAAAETLTSLAYRVAEANGGLFGLFWKVEDSERDALKHIAERLSAVRPDAAARLLKRL